MGDLAETFAERGCLTISRLFEPALIDSIRDEYQRQYGGMTTDSLPAHLKVGDKRVHVPIQVKGPLLDPMLTAHPLLLRMVESIVGADPVIDSMVCVVAFPGSEDQHLHRDHYELFSSEERGGAHLPPFAVTVSIPLIELNAETGSTLLFPGSHKLDPAADGSPPQLGEGELALVPVGGCYFMDYRLWHYGTANGSPLPRPILYIIYARQWFTDSLNFHLHRRVWVAREDVEAMPKAQRRLFRRIAVESEDGRTERCG